jgi:uncharacterized protein YbbC (DUF1343 family)
LPYRTGIAILVTLKTLWPSLFKWRPGGPYEFVTDKPAIDLLTGSDKVRKGIDCGASYEDIVESWELKENIYMDYKKQFHLY